jgi:hypothetical protein
VRRRVVLMSSGAIVTVSLAFGAPIRDRMEDAAWKWATNRPLSGRQARALQACTEVPTAALVKVVAQDLGAACGEAPLLVALGDAARDDEALRGWLVANVDRLTGRARLRSAAAAHRGGADIDLGALAWSPDAAAWLAAAVADGRIDGNWVDPATEDRLALLDPEALGLARRLRASAAAGNEDSAASALAADLLGVHSDPLDWAPDERPPALAPGLRAFGPACAAGHCEALWASWLSLGTETEWTGVTTPASAAAPSLAAFGQGPAWERAQEEQIARWAAWIGAGPRPAPRLWRALGAGAVGDATSPAAALGQGGRPWMLAWLATELGRRTGVPVTVMAPEGWPVLELAGAARTLAGCGGGTSDAWPPDAVLAAALRESGTEAARAVAARLDPLGAADPAAAEGPEGVGRLVGTALRPSAPSGAESSRARAASTTCMPGG